MSMSQGQPLGGVAGLDEPVVVSIGPTPVVLTPQPAEIKLNYAIGIIHAADYRAAKADEFISQFKEALKSVDKVILVDDEVYDSLHYKTIIDILDKEKIQHEVLISKDPAVYVEKIKRQHQDQEENKTNSNPRIFYFQTPKKKMISVPGAELITVNPDKKTKDYESKTRAEDVTVTEMLSIPDKVDLEDLEDMKSGRLFSSEREALLRKAMENQPIGRYSKKEVADFLESKKLLEQWGSFPIYGVVKESRDELFVVYQGEKQGKAERGTFGKVKVVWKLGTNHWDALKSINIRSWDGIEYSVEHELANLKELKLSQSDLMMRRKGFLGFQIVQNKPIFKSCEIGKIYVYKENDSMRCIFKNKNLENKEYDIVCKQEGESKQDDFENKLILEKDQYDHLLKLCEKPSSDLLNVDDTIVSIDIDAKVKKAQKEEKGLDELKLPNHEKLQVKEAFQKKDALKGLFDALLKKGHIKRQYNFIMPYAEGICLGRFREPEYYISSIILLDMAIQSAIELNRLHVEDEYLHLDIKLENIFYDFLSNKITLVDHGISKKMKDGVYKSPHQVGAIGSIAPEIQQREKGDNHYTPAVEVYALGVMLQQFFGLTYVKTDDVSFNTLRSSSLSENDKLRSILESMTNGDPGKRPSLTKVIEELQEIRKDCLPVFPRVTGLIDLQDLALFKENDWLPYIAALQSVDTVIFINSDKNKNVPMENLIQLKRVFATHGIYVRNEVLNVNNSFGLAEKIHALESRKNQNEVSISQICHFHPKGRARAMEGIHSIEVTPHKIDYGMQISESTIPVRQKEIEGLNRVFEKAEKKYGGGEMLQRRADRIKLIAQARQKIMARQGSITYPELFAELDKLQNHIIKTGKYKIGSWHISFGYFKPLEAHLMREIKKEFKEKMPKNKR